MKARPYTLYVYGGSDGPFTCDKPNCFNDTWAILVSKGEEAELSEFTRFEASRKVMEGSFGQALCDDCLEKELK